MWFQTTDRRTLSEILDRSSKEPGTLFTADALPDVPPKASEVIVVWADRPEPGDTPIAIVVEDGQRRDFLAWAATVAPSFRPLTGYIRVINHRTLIGVVEARPRTSRGRGIAAAVGAVLGEALGSSSQSADAPWRECTRTYSYAMARAYALGLLPRLQQEVTEAWSAFVSLTLGAEYRRQLEQLRWPWLALSAADISTGESSAVSEEREFQQVLRSCRELYSTGSLSDRTLNEWLQKWPASADLLPTLRDTREVRVSAFQQFLETVLSARTSLTNTREMSFLVGYMASRLAPGSLEYFRLLRRLEDIIPGVLVWYGITAGLQGDDFIATSGGLGRRLERDLTSPKTFPGRPHADLSVWDLEVFSRSDQHATPLAMLGGSISVELLPDVVCSSQPKTASSAKSTQASAPTQAALPTPSADRGPDIPRGALLELGDLLTELNNALGRVSSVQYKLGRLVDSLDLPRTNRGRARRG